MNNPQSSAFRNALQVSPERIALLNDADLSSLVRHLLHHQAYKCGSPQNEVRINTQGDAADDGCDAWTARPHSKDAWLGFADTCWQLKAGKDGQPAKLRGEVTKPIPRETLAKGGRFVVITPGSTNGSKGEKARLKALTSEASAASLPVDQIFVIGSERLTNWCNQNPAIAANWAGRPDGLWTLENWARSPEHQVTWHATDEITRELEQLRTRLDFAVGDVSHLHVTGLPGVGKTRLVLELCRKAEWCEAVIYIRQAADIRLLELIDGAARDPVVQLLVVADEVQFEQLRPLRDSIDQSNGRIKLISIGHCESPDSSRIPAIQVKPLDDQEMRAIVAAWHSDMPREHVDFVIQFADGYVRLARLAGTAVAKSPGVNVRDLLNQSDIQLFLDRMLEGRAQDRHSLYVVAALSTVGWSDDMDAEGRAIALHFGLDWNIVRADVERFHKRYGIAPKGGRYRYISPTPLGIHLAVEAWTIWPDLMRTLPNVLPSEKAKEAYYERLQSMASNSHARAYAKEGLSFFFRLSDFVSESSARRWSALSCADPELAAERLLRVLKESSVEDREQIAGNARREVVSTLSRIAWRSMAFHDATESLALLAEAENESWASNATGEFIGKFQIYLGGTALPYIDRLGVVDDLLQSDRKLLTGLAIRALAQVGKGQVSRSADRPATDEVPEEEWAPRSQQEHSACVEAAVTRLRAVADRRVEGVQEELVPAAKQLSMLLRKQGMRELVAAFFDSVTSSYPQARESLRRIIADIVASERKHWKQLHEKDLNELEKLHEHFVDNSLAARLQQYVGTPTWEQIDQPDLKPLALELFDSPKDLAEQWKWLTSGEAFDAYRLGCELAAIDINGRLEDDLPNLQTDGNDLRVLCGYVDVRRQSLGDTWFDNWYKSQFQREPKNYGLLFEVAWRSAPTDFTADCVIHMLDKKVNTQLVGPFRYSRWFELLILPKLTALVRAMKDAGHLETAIGILEQRLKLNPCELDQWRELALELVVSPELIRSSDASYHWKRVAVEIVPYFLKEIASAIFREQANKRKQGWFLEHSDAATVVRLCVERAPDETWETVKPFLSDYANARMFAIGFPEELLVAMPHGEILKWISHEPVQRAVIVADMLPKDFTSDDKLPSRILGDFADIKDVDDHFFMALMSGAWHGDSSHHWEQLAAELSGVASRSKLPKLKRWARDAARHLRQMADRDREREAEERLRGR